MSVRKLDDAVEILKSMPDVDFYERIGSLVYYQLNQFYLKTENAKNLFKGTLIEEFIEVPYHNQIISSFERECKRIMSGIYESKLKSFSQEIDKETFYIVFFTGNVKEKGDETRFHECAKFYVQENGIALLNSDNQWQINTSDEISRIWQQCLLWNKTQLGTCLNAALKKHGFKFGSSKKDIIFLPIALTDEFYKLRNIIKTLNNGQLSIAPVIAGCKQDAEEYRKIVTDSFESEFMEGKKLLFEIAIYLYSQHREWQQFKELAEKREIEKLKLTYIAQKTRYGGQLARKLEIVDRNSCDAEYDEIVNDWVKSVKPCQRVQTGRLFAIQETLKQALNKLDNASQCTYFADLRKDIEQDILVTAKILAKISEQTIDQVLSII